MAMHNTNKNNKILLGFEFSTCYICTDVRAYIGVRIPCENAMLSIYRRTRVQGVLSWLHKIMWGSCCHECGNKAACDAVITRQLSFHGVGESTSYCTLVQRVVSIFELPMGCIEVSEQKCLLHICFFKTMKAYDTVNRNVIWSLLLNCDLPLVTVIHKLHEGIYEACYSPFDIINGHPTLSKTSSSKAFSVT